MRTLIEQNQETLEANEWFKLQDIPTFIDSDDTLYIEVGDGFEIQISTAEVSYRAELFRNLEKQNLIKDI